MNITFLIGNGFDLNLGLNTTYVDFIKEYVKESPEDVEIIKTFKKDLAKDKKNTNLWADAELAMGQYSIHIAKEYGQNAAEVYCDIHDDFCEKLSEYLKKEQTKVKMDELKTFFVKSILNIIEGFSLEQTNQLSTLIKQNHADKYNFIIYNYTMIIDGLIKKGDVITEHLFKFTNGSTVKYRDIINDMIHAHGTINEAMVFGVNDITQIGEPKIFDGQPEEYKNTFLKKEFNAMVEEMTFEKTQAILNSSNLIYIYGMSLGETDKIWWEKIYELLKSKKDLHIIIYAYEMPINRLAPRKGITFSRELKKKLINYGLKKGEDDDNEILKRIHITGENIFSEMKGFAKELSSTIVPNFNENNITIDNNKLG